MNIDFVKNILTSYDRIPELRDTPVEQETNSLVKKKLKPNTNVSAEYKPLIDSVKSYQEIKKVRMELLESRKNG